MPLDQFYILMQIVVVILLIGGTIFTVNQAVELFNRLRGRK